MKKYNQLSLTTGVYSIVALALALALVPFVKVSAATGQEAAQTAMGNLCEQLNELNELNESNNNSFACVAGGGGGCCKHDSTNALLPSSSPTG